MKIGDIGYITVYATTKGVFKGVVTDVHDYEKYTSIQFSFNKWASFRLGVDCFASLEDAIRNGEERRLKRIESVKKQLDKLERLDVSKGVKDYTNA